MSGVLLVVPLYNHAATLPAVLTDLQRLNLPVLVVNDGSTDEPGRVQTDFPDVLWVNQPHNKGKGAAIALAMAYAAEKGCDAIVSFDADGQHLAKDVEALLTTHRRHPAALIIGERDFTSAVSGEVPGSSRFGRRFSNFWIWVETGQRLGDTQSGLRIYPVDLELLRKVRGRRYAFEIEVITRSLWSGRQVLGVPVGVFYPPKGERVSHFHAWRDNARLSATHTWMCTLRLLQLLQLYRPKRQQGAPQATKEVAGMSLTARFIAAFGPRPAYALLIFPVLTMFLARAPERRAMLDFYRQCRPQWSLPRRWLAVLRNYALFAASIVDRTRAEGAQLVQPGEDSAQLEKLGAASSQGLILLGAHYGDWMLIARRLQPFLKRPLGLVLDPGVTPRFFQEVEKQLAGRLTIIDPRQDGFSFAVAVQEVLAQGGIVAFLADRKAASGNGSALTHPFLGKPRAWPKTPFAIAARLQLPVFFVCATKQNLQPSAVYHVALKPLSDAGEVTPGGAAALLERFATALEDQVQAAPQHWFNFFPFWPPGGVAQ